MCGITGYSGRGDRRIVEMMNETLRHRGPDDAGVFISAESTPRVGNNVVGSNDVPRGTTGLAQRRLAIIDLSPAGHQPMSNEDSTIQIVFNGEIYNFAELRAGLSEKHSFKSQSDTEVIIHLYEEIGTEVFSKIQGMFAIVLFDSRKNILILARDRMGKKPLYWSVQNGTLMFGSELKALMKHPSFKKEIDPVSLNKYIFYEYVPTPATIFKNTYKLEPGTFLVWDGQTAKKESFWNPTFMPKKASFADTLADLDRDMSAAVSDRLVSDVPVGVFLSGGIDSSAVAYYAAKKHSNIKTFSIGFTEASFDESAHARKVAAYLGTDHHEKILSADECLKLLPKIADSLDEPMADSSIIPTYLLSQFTREHVTVALGGDGGDELFCGYDTMLAQRFSGIYEVVPHFIRTGIIEPLVRALPTSYGYMSLDFKIKKFIGGFMDDRNALYRNQRWLGSFSHAERQALFVPKLWAAVKNTNEFDDIDRYEAETDSNDIYDRLAHVYQRMFMMDQVLVKVDRASMMNSLEVRAPFLDTRVVDLANHMPTNFKFKGLTRKFILKKLMEGKLPHDIIYRKKKGFGMPTGKWISGGLKPLVQEVLGRKSILNMGYFNPDAVEKLLTDHFAGKKDNRKQIWTLLMFGLWWKKWGR